MKTLTVGTKSQADKVLVNSLFAPVNGSTLNKEKLCTGKYQASIKGRALEVSDHIHAVWAEKRRDSDGEYFALLCLTSRS